MYGVRKLNIHFLHSDPGDTTTTPIITSPSFCTTVTSAQLCPLLVTTWAGRSGW
jgi:hypothetical protein